MDDIKNDSTKNALTAFCEEPGLQENHYNPNLLGSIVDLEEDLTMNDDVSDYSHQNDPLKTFNEESIPAVVVTNPVEACLSDILLRLRECFIYFDGTTKSFRKCSGASLESAIAEQPDGAEGFSFEWFGIALSIVRDVLKQEFRKKRELSTLRPLPITIHAARLNFISGLELITSHVTRDWLRLCHPPSPRDSLPQIKLISKKILDNWVASHQLPDSMSSRYSSAVSETPIDSLQDLEILLIADAGVWIASFFPLFHSLSQNAYNFVNPIWFDKRIDQFDPEEFSNQIYILCMQRSLLKNKAGLFRGVVVLKSWLTGLLDWLMRLLLHNGEERDMSLIPGPIDTFPCMKVDSHNPSKHWLLPEVKNSVDVIPERLFCLLSQLFGCGIKYTTYGDFTLRDQFIRALKPIDLRIEVSFCWFQTVDDILEEKNVHVFVENALYRTDITEVIRLAYQILKKEDAMSAVQLQLWAAATNGPTSLIVRAKHLNSEFLMPPLDIEFYAHGLTMSSLIKTMVEQLGEHLKFEPQQELSIGIELQLRTTKIGHEKNISSVVTLQTVKRCGLCGLTNVGNTCYMNSALQCLSNIPHFRDQILYFPVSHYTNAPLTSSVVDLLAEMWSGHSEYVNTATLYSFIGQKVKRFTGHQQQDACEFVEVLLDRMQEELNDVSERCYRERLDTDKNIPLIQLSEIFWNNFLDNNTSFISKDFFHQSKTVFTCLTCEETSVVFDNNITLSLSIRETKTQNAIVVVQKPPFGVSGDNAKGYSTGSMLANLEDQVVCISIDVHIMNDESGVTSEMKLKKAIRNALCDCLELKKKIASNLPTDVDPTEEPVEFDYHVEILDVPTKGFGKVYAWARCVMRGTVECSSRVGFADIKHKEETNLESFSRSGGYRIWYFLKCDDGDSLTAHDTPIYVEELPLSFPCTEDSFSSKTDAAGGWEGNEGVYLAQEGSLSSSRPAPAPFSNHILSLSRNIAQSFLVPCSGEPKGFFAPPASMSDDHDDASVFFPLESHAKEHDTVPLKVMHCLSGKSLLIDINECSKTDGDDWLEGLRTYDAVKVKRRKKHKSGASTHGGLACVDKITNVSIFLCFKSDCFRVKVPRMIMRSNSERSHSAYLRLPNREENGDSDPMCTLYDCLEQSMIPDTLTDDNSWYCPHCKDFREARLQRNVFRVPPCLIISFKALKMINTYHADKNTTPVDFPLQFDFSPYLDVESALLTQDTVYRLRGVVYHSGSLNFGHYTAYAFNDNINKWVYFDDSRSYVMDLDKPPSFGAYMLFYERISHAKS
ncbi:unnamed protein product [Phytomonas sp. EM1]|nr:unnamed protein product [Phytomonas sp. EM1]|eukprot:CCW60353.1 unnamed protein product [Phytomonas sp. isolate EM1]